jgi:hypothetical protein
VLNGGLGNQLFGWALGYTISISKGYSLILTTSELIERDYELHKFGIEHSSNLRSKKYPFSSSILLRVNRKIGRYKVKFGFVETGFQFDQRFLNPPPNKTFYGYFQSWKYFEAHKIRINEFLTSRYIRSSDYYKIKNIIKEKNYISVHVRRGDYLSKENYHSLTTKDYYNSGLEKIARDEKTLIVCFSDSIELAKQVCRGCDYYFGPSEINDPAAILMIMSEGMGLIGANSSLSWWAGYLMNKNAIKIFPSTWFEDKNLNTDDLIPSNWIQI